MDRKRKTKEPCSGCGLHIDFCICEHMIPAENKVHVSLIVHYKELKRTTNTGRLIARCLKNQNIVIRGEIGKPTDQVLTKPGFQPILLFPSDDSTPIEKFTTNEKIQLIVPDGNWRQASKVAKRYEELKGIPRIKISNSLWPKTSIRKETSEFGMATLQAIAHCLYYLETPDIGEYLNRIYQLKARATLKSRG